MGLTLCLAVAPGQFRKTQQSGLTPLLRFLDCRPHSDITGQSSPFIFSIYKGGGCDGPQIRILVRASGCLLRSDLESANRARRRYPEYSQTGLLINAKCNTRGLTPFVAHRRCAGTKSYLFESPYMARSAMTGAVASTLVETCHAQGTVSATLKVWRLLAGSVTEGPSTEPVGVM